MNDQESSFFAMDHENMFMYFHWKQKWPIILLFLPTSMGGAAADPGELCNNFTNSSCVRNKMTKYICGHANAFFFCQGKCILRIKIECNLIEFARIKEVVIEVDWLRRRSRSRNVWSRSTNRIRCGLRGRHLLPDPNWTPHLANV